MSAIQIESPSAVGLRRASLSAVVIRADGSVEDLGVIAETNFHRQRLTRAAGALALAGIGLGVALALRSATRP